MLILRALLDRPIPDPRLLRERRRRAKCREQQTSEDNGFHVGQPSSPIPAELTTSAIAPQALEIR
jgi:hypothetical protein